MDRNVGPHTLQAALLATEGRMLPGPVLLDGAALGLRVPRLRNQCRTMAGEAPWWTVALWHGGALARLVHDLVLHQLTV